ncbi:MAG: DUF1987 domain-containing protein [Bacteroidales bacterium]|nr:DUF1987 domain-containing protein [Bacteroidales bacterium]HPD96024.1 DUF1987 domain-containing protein [Tenuifilaceae bacterium]HRX31673.1 DUF1987 domain-containing protein [Tenuifilaceae bacterium]
MKSLKIEETVDSPEVNLDKERGRFEFYGKSLPENPKDFYQPIIDWFKEYAENPNRDTVIIFKMDYFNTASSKKILEILSVLHEIHAQKKNIIVNWFYRSIDEDMLETGETFSELVKVPFKLIPY